MLPEFMKQLRCAIVKSMRLSREERIMSKYQMYLDCDHQWDWEYGGDKYCEKCDINRSELGWIQEVVTLENQRDELLEACEAGGEYDGDEIDGPLALRLTARYLDYSFYGELSALLNEKADAEEAAIAKVKGAADE